MQLPRVARGDPVTADLMNMIIGVVERGVSLSAGPGVSVTGADNRFTVALAKILGEHVRLARIIARTGQPVDRAGAITYDVQEYETGNVMTGAVPYWGRPVRDDEIAIGAAEVGTLCFIVREPMPDGSLAGRLWIPSGGASGEVLAFATCEGSGTPGPPPGVRIVLGPESSPVVDGVPGMNPDGGGGGRSPMGGPAGDPTDGGLGEGTGVFTP